MQRFLRFAACAALVLLCVTATSSCASRDAVLPGEYGAGSRLALEGGGSLTVPAEWRASVITTGAVVHEDPDETGILGGTVESESHPGDTMTFTVYGPEAGFDTIKKRLAALPTRSDDATGPGAVHTAFTYDGARVTAVVSQFGAADPQAYYEIDVVIERQRARPVIIAASLDGMPPSLGATVSSDTARKLLEYLEFESR